MRRSCYRTRRTERRSDSMRRFTALYEAIDQTTSTNAKVAALAAYFRDAPPADAAWAIFFLTGRRLKRVVPSAGLREWAQEVTRHSRLAAGRVLLRRRRFRRARRAGARRGAAGTRRSRTCRSRPGSRTGCCRCRRPIPPAQRAMVTQWWLGLPRAERFLLNKLLTGEFRVGVAHTLVVRALAIVGGDRADESRGAADGRLDAVGGVVHGGRRGRRGRRGSVAAVSVLSRGAARRAARGSRRSRRLARRMEVGRHPRSARSAGTARRGSGRAAKS